VRRTQRTQLQEMNTLSSPKAKAWRHGPEQSMCHYGTAVALVLTSKLAR
jgi:hypothetical protein